MKKRSLAFFAVLALFGIGSAAVGQSNVFGVSAEGESSRFEGETEVDRSELAFTLTGSSITETAQSFSLTMQSVKIEAWNNGNRYNDVFSLIDDENFVDVSTAKDAATTAYEKAQADGTEYVPAEFNGSIFNVSYKKNSTIVLPQHISYGSDPVYFRINLSSIGTEVCFDYKKNEVSYAGISTIVIPEGYETIHADAFTGAKEAGVTIKVAASEDLPGWEKGWTDADVEYGYELSSTEAKQLDVNTTGSTSFGDSKDFFVGYFDSEDESKNKPLVMEYSLLDENDSKASETLYYEVPLNATQVNYDAVGSTAGKGKDDRNIDIEIPSGTHVDESSIVFHNIYRLVKNDAGGVTPDWESGAFKATPTRSYSKVSHIEDFISVKAGFASYIGQYSRFSISINPNYDIFKTLNPSSYENNKTSIENGILRIRILFSSLPSAKYRVVYIDKDGQEVTKTIPVVTPISVTEVEGDKTMGFLIKNSDVAPDFSNSKVVSLQLCGFYLQTDLFNPVKNTITSNSKKSVRFASLELLPEGIAGVKNVSVGAYLGISYGVYAFLFIAGAVAYWAYCKKKYRNDEFRRVDNKKFFLASLRNFFGYALILSSILFIIARWGLFNDTVVVYNPLDVWVIVFTIAGAIFLGIAIKDFVVSMKKNMERKKKEKLHLDADAVEDGTK